MKSEGVYKTFGEPLVPDRYGVTFPAAINMQFFTKDLSYAWIKAMLLNEGLSAPVLITEQLVKILKQGFIVVQCSPDDH